MSDEEWKEIETYYHGIGAEEWAYCERRKASSSTARDLLRFRAMYREIVRLRVQLQTALDDIAAIRKVEDAFHV